MSTIPYAVGICFASVCTDDTDAEAAASLNLQRPTGVTPWRIHPEPFADGSPNPSPCEHDPARRHVLFSC